MTNDNQESDFFLVDISKTVRFLHDLIVNFSSACTFAANYDDFGKKIKGYKHLGNKTKIYQFRNNYLLRHFRFTSTVYKFAYYHESEVSRNFV